jgi:HD-GYP domain-containing protein (c-di-GMP phosphodiesterase class II)
MALGESMQYKDLRMTVVNIFKAPRLRNIYIGCLIIAILLPTYSTLFVMPSFVEQLTKDTEDDANRTAVHLASSLSLETGVLTRNSFSTKVTRKIEQSVNDLRLEKVKVFSRSGQIIYSTDIKDIGTINEKPYFHNVVAKGKTYSLIVRKNGKTAENRTVSKDVAEVYIPIMRNNVFGGAFEIYYDITERKQALGRLLFQSSMILYAMAIAFLLSVMGMLLKISEAKIRRDKAEKRLEESHNNLRKLVAEQVSEILVTQKTSVEALAVLAEYYDSNTGEHLVRIRQYVVLLVSWLQYNSPYSEYITTKADYVNEVAFASLLHDIGKVAIPKEILTKPARLTVEEFDIVKQHTLIAGKVLGRANATFVESFGKDSYLALARDIALYHHEKWNGGGYPGSLKGDAIPLCARIVALADVYDALTSVRPYKDAFTHADSVNIISKGKGEHFDPYVVDAFLAQSDKFCEISSRSKAEGEKETLQKRDAEMQTNFHISPSKERGSASGRLLRLSRTSYIPPIKGYGR